MANSSSVCKPQKSNTYEEQNNNKYGGESFHFCKINQFLTKELISDDLFLEKFIHLLTPFKWILLCCFQEKFGILYSNMKDNPGRSDQELKELLARYNNYKSGNNPNFLEEESFERIIDYFDDTDQLSLAIEAAEHGIELYPYSSLLLIKKADLLIAAGKHRESLDILEHVGVLDQSDINVYILQIEAFLGLNMAEKAKEIFTESCKIFEGGDKLELLFNLSDVFDDYEQFDEVFQCLELILKDDPSNEEALYKICFWTDYTGKFEESIALHKKIIDDVPYNHLAWYNLGTAFQGLKLYEKAIDAYLYAITIDEKFDYAYRNLGDAYIRIRNFKEAAEALEKVLELSIPEDIIYEALGHCYEKMKDTAQARTNYRKAIHLKPEDSHLYYRVAATFMQEANWKKAIQQLESAISFNHNNPDYQFALAQCHQCLGNVKDAVTYYVLFIAARSKSIKGWKAMITCLFDAGYMDEALAEADAALMATGKPIFLYFRAAILLELGKNKEALLILQSALEIAPKNLKDFIALNPAVIQRASVVKLINAMLHSSSGRKHRK